MLVVNSPLPCRALCFLMRAWHTTNSLSPVAVHGMLTTNQLCKLNCDPVAWVRTAWSFVPVISKLHSKLSGIGPGSYSLALCAMRSCFLKIDWGGICREFLISLGVIAIYSLCAFAGMLILSVQSIAVLTAPLFWRERGLEWGLLNSVVSQSFVFWFDSIWLLGISCNHSLLNWTFLSVADSIWVDCKSVQFVGTIVLELTSPCQQLFCFLKDWE